MAKKPINKGDLKNIPGVGEKLSECFSQVGIKKISDLKGKTPEKLYQKICNNQGKMVDRCVLYVLRSSVYFAENKEYDSEKLKWWNWKD